MKGCQNGMLAVVKCRKLHAVYPDSAAMPRVGLGANLGGSDP